MKAVTRGHEPVLEGIRPLGFLQDARDLLRTRLRTFPRATKKSRSLVPYFLVCRSIELSLKAFLLSRGVGLDVLASKQVGHNLKTAYEQSLNLGLGDYVRVPAQEELALRVVNEYYRTKHAEYFYFPKPIESGWRVPPSLAALTSLASRLVAGTRPACIEFNAKTRTKWTRGPRPSP